MTSSYKSITLWLIGLNVAVFFLTYVSGSTRLMANLALSPSGLRQGMVWQLVTYMFVHGNFQHILFNMLGLFFFGIQVERTMGSWEFLAFYFVTGVLSGLTAFVFYLLAGVNAYLLGASGAVFAVLFAFAMYYPNARVFIMGLIPIRSLYLVILYAGIEIFSQVFGTSQGVAHLAHLGGLAFAFLYFLLRLKINPIDIFKRGRNRNLH